MAIAFRDQDPAATLGRHEHILDHRRTSCCSLHRHRWHDVDHGQERHGGGLA